jgi:uncharacterized protein YkwD
MGRHHKEELSDKELKALEQTDRARLLAELEKENTPKLSPDEDLSHTAKKVQDEMRQLMFKKRGRSSGRKY